MGLNAVSGMSGGAPGPIGAGTPSTGRFTGLQAATVTKTLAYTATSSDFTILCDATTAAFSVTLPAAAANPGRIFNVKKIDSSANAVTIQANGAELIDGANTKVVGAQYQSAQIQSNGIAWFVL
jgi:hypothetical protein